MQDQKLGWREAFLAFVILTVAAGARVGYLLTCVADLQVPPPYSVQDAETAITLDRPNGGAALPRTDREQFAENIDKYNWYGSRAPFTDREELTAYLAPGYPSLLGNLQRWIGDAGLTTQLVLWTQCALGALTALFYFLFGRLAFGSSFVGVLAGLLAAIHPFWIINGAELQDGTLVCFLLAACLFLGAEGSGRGSPLASLLFGGSLAGMSLVRAALLPFSIFACLWFLLGCRKLPRGWLCGLLAVLGFANGLAPWTIRNYQVFGHVVPVTDSLFVHLWMGNNAKAHGGPQDEATLRESLPPERLQALEAEQNQVLRYRMLAQDVWQGASTDPAGTLEKRIRSGVCFVFGGQWLEDSRLWHEAPRPETPAWIVEGLPVALWGMLLVMLICGLIGWRWSSGWSREAGLASLALVWIPVPYLLSHAEHFSGPRLPFDGVLLCYVAFVLASILPPGARLLHKPQGQ